jgi:hypothetical protein
MAVEPCVDPSHVIFIHHVLALIWSGVMHLWILRRAEVVTLTATNE